MCHFSKPWIINRKECKRWPLSITLDMCKHTNVVCRQDFNYLPLHMLWKHQLLSQCPCWQIVFISFMYFSDLYDLFHVKINLNIVILGPPKCQVDRVNHEAETAVENGVGTSSSQSVSNSAVLQHDMRSINACNFVIPLIILQLWVIMFV